MSSTRALSARSHSNGELSARVAKVVNDMLVCGFFKATGRVFRFVSAKVHLGTVTEEPGVLRLLVSVARRCCQRHNSFKLIGVSYFASRSSAVKDQLCHLTALFQGHEMLRTARTPSSCA